MHGAIYGIAYRQYLIGGLVNAQRSTTFAATLVAGSLLVSLSACAPAGEAEPTPSTSAVAADETLAALLPASVVEAGAITVGASIDYPPDNFLGEDGETPTGYMIDLVNAVGDRLGVEIEYSRIDFASILTGIEGGRYDVGISFLDTKERQAVVDMVDVYGVAQSFLIMAGSEWDGFPCGKKVGVGAGSIEESILADLSQTECVDQGEPAVEVLTSPNNPQAQTAMSSGRVEAVFSATAPAAWAVEESDGAFEIAGDPIKASSGLTGMAVTKKQEGLSEALRAAVQSLIDDGTYEEILDTWGVSGLALDEATINAAQE
jgi:polar amino acid transport system substrate-binding protein